jgi:clan AA aspartic protease
MEGRVDDQLQPIVSLRIRNAQDEYSFCDIAAVIDTGFTGFLTLPSTLIQQLNLSWLGRTTAIIANGSSTEFDLFEANVEWGYKLRRVEVEAVDGFPLLGMGLLEGYELRIEAIADGAVHITRWTGKAVLPMVHDLTLTRVETPA